ncbi:hypothetical protein [Nannocystis pusilla]|uniref:hypothetical protein n=1 Tax=Nannocystis pusilla TaxID=889268 RepID=UPI003B7D9F31
MLEARLEDLLTVPLAEARRQLGVRPETVAAIAPGHELAGQLDPRQVADEGDGVSAERDRDMSLGTGRGGGGVSRRTGA